MDILGIGNALLDIFWFSDDESSLAFGLHPNSASHVEPDRLDELLIAVSAPILVAGGSASNSLKAAAALGATTAFIGCTGSEDRESDQWARAFRDDLNSFGIECRLEDRPATTGRCLVIHMPGFMKSIACAPGAATGFRAGQVAETDVEQTRLVLLDGQVLRNEAFSAHVTSLCLKKKKPLAIDVGSPDIASSYAPLLRKLLEESELLLFMNDEESFAFARELSPEAPNTEDRDRFIDRQFSALTPAGRTFPIIVRKQGPLGATLWQDGRKIEGRTESAGAILDDTGAGDTFNGAFLAGWLGNRESAGCLAFANAAARESLFVPGTRLDPDRFSELKKRL